MNIKQIKLLTLMKGHQFNISACAQQMHIVQSAASKMLSELERELDLSIVTRNGKRITGFTPEGEVLYRHALRVIQETEAITQFAAEHHGVETGTLNIGTTLMQARYFLPSIVRDFRAAHPKIKISFTQAHPNQLLELLQQDALDVVICSEVLSEHSRAFEQHLCYEWRHVLLLPEKHPLTSVRAPSLTDIADFPICTYPLKLSGRTSIEHAFALANLKPNVVLESADPSVIRSYVELGLGVGIIAEPAYLFEDNARLVAKPLHTHIATSRTIISIRPGKLSRGYLKDFVDITHRHGQEFAQTLHT